ncbi:MAG: hypothetical protein ACI4L9_00300 [Candidatus Coproplasma sp.]
MKRLNFPLVLDSFLAATCAFLFFFTFIRFYTKSAVWGLVFGACAFIITGATAFLYIRKRQNEKLTLSRDARRAELLKLHLCLLSEGELKRTLLPLIDGGKISGKTIETPERTHYLIFCLQPLSPDDIAGVIRKSGKKSKVILCNAISEEAKKLAENFEIDCVTGDEIYSRLKERNLLPEKYAFEGEKRLNFFARVSLRFNRRLAAPLFWSGLGLTAFSYFTFYPVYYIISGGVLLVLAAICLVFGKRKSG